MEGIMENDNDLLEVSKISPVHDTFSVVCAWVAMVATLAICVWVVVELLR